MLKKNTKDVFLVEISCICLFFTPQRTFRIIHENALNKPITQFRNLSNITRKLVHVLSTRNTHSSFAHILTHNVTCKHNTHLHYMCYITTFIYTTNPSRATEHIAFIH